MPSGFWKKLKKPIFALAPMYNVTDAAFRFIIAKYGKPHVMWTEFVSADGLISNGFERLKHHLIHGDLERPIVAQIFGKNPDAYFKAAELLASMKFDGIDINMGCPDKNIMKQVSCAALYNNPKLAKELILSAQNGAPNLPVSVKIRIGDAKIGWESWIYSLLETKPAAITIHLRTRKEMSKVQAHWELMPEIVRFIHKHSLADERPIILGNGDVKHLADAEQKIKESNCDGAMLGRAIFGNPWLFNRSVNVEKVSLPEKMNVMLEHTRLFEKLLGKEKSFELMKKHYKAYFTGFDSAKDLRAKLMLTHSVKEVEETVKKHFEKINKS